MAIAKSKRSLDVGMRPRSFYSTFSLRAMVGAALEVRRQGVARLLVATRSCCGACARRTTSKPPSISRQRFCARQRAEDVWHATWRSSLAEVVPGFGTYSSKQHIGVSLECARNLAFGARPARRGGAHFRGAFQGLSNMGEREKYAAMHSKPEIPFGVLPRGDGRMRVKNFLHAKAFPQKSR